MLVNSHKKTLEKVLVGFEFWFPEALAKILLKTRQKPEKKIKT